MRRVALSSAQGTLCAEALPDYGGMICALSFSGVPLLRMNEGLLGVGNVLSGGIPVLFPFASKTRDNRYTLRKKTYCMPMHGFVKDMPFAVEAQTAHRCTLTFSPPEAAMRHYYPFDFLLTLEYALSESALTTCVTVENRSREPMPLALGFHPYFCANPAHASLHAGMADYWDYTRPAPLRGRLAGAPDLTHAWDHVLTGERVDAVLDDHARGLRVRIAGDPSFKVLTLCTIQPGAICVEPWQAAPDALHCGGELHVAPGARARYAYSIEVSRLSAPS